MSAESAVLIVGALGGIGRAVVTREAAQGRTLFLVDSADPDALEALAAQACESGAAQAHSLHCDVASEQNAARVRAWLSSKTSSLEGFACVAGVTGPVAAVSDYPYQAFAEVLRINVHGPFLLLRELLSLLEAGSGSVVLAGSTSSLRGRRGLSGYVASKHALLGLVRAAALDLNHSGIRVNAVLPGPVATPMLQELAKAASEFGEDASFGRASDVAPGTPEEVAAFISFLLGPDSRHIHGQGLVIDGGVTVG